MRQKRDARTLKEAFGPYADWPVQRKDDRAARGAMAAAIAAGYAVAAVVLLTDGNLPPPPDIVKPALTAQARP